MEMRLHYKLHLEDIIQYYLHMSRTSPQFRHVVKKRQLRLFVLLFLAALIYAFIWPVSSPVYFYISSTVLAFLAAYWYSFYIYYRLERRLRKFHSKGNEGSLYREKIVEIDQNGVFNQAEEMEGIHYKWSSIKEVYITSLYIYIHVNSISAVMIPRRAFHDAAAWEKCKSVVTSYQTEARRSK